MEVSLLHLYWQLLTEMSGYRHWAGRRILGGKRQLLVSNSLATSTSTLLAEGDYQRRVRAGRREYLERGVLQLYCLTAISLVLAPYWQERIPGGGSPASVLAAISLVLALYWRWVSYSCTGSCLAAISFVLALYWQKRVAGGGSPASVLAAV